jgi:acetyl esterase/lipase
MIHGGGHIMLSRNDVRPEQIQILLKSGFLPISIDYRLCPEVTILEGPITDVADAIAWVRKKLPNILLSRPDIQVDGDRVVSVGWSTGGTLAMSLAWTSTLRGIQPPEAILVFYGPSDYEDSFWTKPNVPAGLDKGSSYDLDESIWGGIRDYPITSYNVPPTKRAMGGWMAPSDPRSRLALYMNVHGRTLHVLLNGLDKKTRVEPAIPAPSDISELSPLAQIRKGAYATPTFVIHPRQDDLIPWQQAHRSYTALRERGIDSELRILENVPHLFDVYREYEGNQAARAVVAEGYEFLCRYV